MLGQEARPIHPQAELALPANLTPLFLPAYLPELNAIERVWLYLRERFLSHRLWSTYDDILDACCAAWNALLAEPGRIRSLCSLGRHGSVGCKAESLLSVRVLSILPPSCRGIP